MHPTSKWRTPLLKGAWLIDWLIDRTWLANPVIDWGGGEWNDYEISPWPHGIIEATCITECTASICKCNNYDYHFLCIHSNHLSNCIQHLIPELYPAWFTLFLVICMTSYSTMSSLCVMCQPIAAFLHLSGTACSSMSAMSALLEEGIIVVCFSWCTEVLDYHFLYHSVVCR